MRSRGALLGVVWLAGCGADDLAAPLEADAGFDLTAGVGAQVALTGRAVDREDDPQILYDWRLISAPPGGSVQLFNPETAEPLLVPQTRGDYVLSLVVRDDIQSSRPDYVVVAIRNPPPEVTINCDVSAVGQSPDCLALHGSRVFLDARQSLDPDGEPLTFVWSQVTDLATCPGRCPELPTCDGLSTTTLSLSNPTTSLASVTLPDTSGDQFVFALTVSDATEETDACVRYQTYNTPPTAMLAASVPTAVDEGTTFVLDAAPSVDADNDSITYFWEQVQGSPNAVISNATAVSTSVAAPTVTGSDPTRNLIFRLTVSDGLDSASLTFTVVIRNIG